MRCCVILLNTRKLLYLYCFQAEQDALSAVELWEKQTGRLFLVNGSRFKDHVKNQWQEFRAERAEEQIRQVNIMGYSIVSNILICLSMQLVKHVNKISCIEFIAANCLLKLQ